MPYSKIFEAPKALRSAGLTLKQINYWMEIYDKVKKKLNIKSPAAISWFIFKKKYYQSGKIWKLKKISKGEKMSKTNSIKGYELVYRESPLISALENADAEGKFYEKELIREGSWAHPQKQNIRFKVTTKRMQTWVDNFNKKLFKVPVPKRHSLDPEDNRGWVTGLSIRKNLR